MADDEDQVEDETGEEDEGKKGGKKKLLLILVPILLLGGGAGGAYYMGMLDGLLGIEAAECEKDEHGEDVEDCEHSEEGDEHGEDDDGHGKKKSKKDDGHGDGHGEDGEASESAFLAIPPMIVNLNTEDGTPRFLRLTVQLELADPDEKADVEAVIPKVIDQFQTYLRELRVRDLRGSAGVYRLQMELLWRVNQAVEPAEIKDVLFQEILIQ